MNVIFVLLMICFILLKDTSYDMGIKWAIFGFLIGILVINAYTRFINKPGGNKSKSTKLTKVAFLVSITITLLLAYAQYAKTIH